MVFVHFAMVILFAGLGIWLLSGKAAEKLIPLSAASVPQKYNLPAVLRFIGLILVLLSAASLIMAAHIFFQSTLLLWIGIGLMAALPLFAVIYLFSSGRFLNKKDE